LSGRGVIEAQFKWVKHVVNNNVITLHKSRQFKLFINQQVFYVSMGNDDSIFICVYNRCRTIIKSCVAANIIFFHRELCLESVMLWWSSIKVTKVKSHKEKHQQPFTTYLSPPVFAGLMAVSKILYTVCSFLGMITMSIICHIIYIIYLK